MVAEEFRISGRPTDTARKADCVLRAESAGLMGLSPFSSLWARALQPHTRSIPFVGVNEDHAGSLKGSSPLVHRPLLGIAVIDLKIFDRASADTGPISEIFPGPADKGTRGAQLSRRYHQCSRMLPASNGQPYHPVFDLDHRLFEIRHTLYHLEPVLSSEVPDVASRFAGPITPRSPRRHGLASGSVHWP